MRLVSAFVVGGLAAAPVAAAAKGPAIVVEHPQLRSAAPGAPTGAGYMVLRNTSDAPDRLIGASCACADQVVAHETMAMNGVSHMEMEAQVEIPAHRSTIFAPGARHLMLMGLKAPLRAGAHVTITLRFARAGAAPAVFTVTDTPAITRQHGR